MASMMTTWMGSAAASALLLLALAVSPVSAQSDRTPLPPTFAKDIAPLFQDKCEACHRADGMAPMSLSTYAEVRPWARSIRNKVANREMPPWYIDKTVGIQ